MAGLTREGLTILRQNEIVERLRQRAIPVFQDLVPPNETVNTGNDSTIGRMIALNSVEFTDLWELGLAVYQAFDPDSAWGVALDNLVQYAGLERFPATPTTVTMDLWVEDGVTIPLTTLQFRSQEGRFYQSESNFTADSSVSRGAQISVISVTEGESYSVDVKIGNSTSSATVQAVYGDTQDSVLSKLLQEVRNISGIRGRVEGRSLVVELPDDSYGHIGVTTRGDLRVDLIKTRIVASGMQRGDFEQEPHSVNQIATPTLGIHSATNPFYGTRGRNEETDDELRERFRVSKAKRATNIVEALYAHLLDVEGVRYVKVYENDTSVPDDEYELPPHSFRVVVLGGLNEDVAKGIWLNKPAGIETVGNTLVDIRDSQGFPQTMKFDRPEEVPVYIKINIKKFENKFPEDGEELIKRALIDYFRDSVFIGVDVVYSRLYTPINSVQGFQVESLEIGRDANNLSTNNIPISFREVASLFDEDIEIISQE